MAQHQARRDKLRRLIKKTDAEAMLVTDVYNVTYLTGFTGDSSYLLVTPQTDVLLTDKRYTTQLADECPHLKVEDRDPDVKLHELTAKIVKRAKVKSLAFEAHIQTVSVQNVLEEAIDKVDWAPTTDLVESLRMIKDKDEIATIRRAVRCAERAFETIKPSLRVEQTEKEVNDLLEQQVRLLGGRRTAFDPIVAVGHWAALPHATPGDRKIGDADFVLFDWGAEIDGYKSDLTRVVATNKISAKLRKIYETVKTAQQKAIDKIRDGAVMKDVDAAARGHIHKSGFGKYFGHGLGHGIGLFIHENPRMGPKEEGKLKAGMVVTVEPGIYVPGWGGVRIEDDVLVTKNGSEVLSTLTKDLDEMVVRCRD